jgi:stringent starvation protein B
VAERSTKPYLIRAVHEWACDSGLTPYISVKVDENTRVPAEHVRDGEIVLNLGYDATNRLTIGNDLIQFSARFGGVSRECSVPVAAVHGIFARRPSRSGRVVVRWKAPALPRRKNRTTRNPTHRRRATARVCKSLNSPVAGAV